MEAMAERVTGLVSSAPRAPAPISRKIASFRKATAQLTLRRCQRK